MSEREIRGYIRQKLKDKNEGYFDKSLLDTMTDRLMTVITDKLKLPFSEEPREIYINIDTYGIEILIKFSICCIFHYAYRF